MVHVSTKVLECMSTPETLNAAQLAGSQIPADAEPFALFDAWMAEAQRSELNDANAMALATATAQAAPSVRMVLLKGHGREEGAECGVVGGGFTFFTNMGSRKGTDLAANQQAAILFHWKSLRRQIRVEGELTEVSSQRADAYFHSRPYKSQVGSAASEQSRPLPERQTYLDRVQELWAAHEADGEVPRPDHWTGFTLSPRRIEFWMDRANRLHDRRVFTRESGAAPWSNTLLYP